MLLLHTDTEALLLHVGTSSLLHRIIAPESFNICPRQRESRFPAVMCLSVFTIVLPFLSVFILSLATVYLIDTEEVRMWLSVEPICMNC